MIFIVGTHPKMEKYRSKKMEHCFYCNNDSHWILQKTQQYLSLFFLSIVPVKTEYIYYCPICGQGETLNRQDFEDKVFYEAEPLS